jgi:hypothetical protein
MWMGRRDTLENKPMTNMQICHLYRKWESNQIDASLDAFCQKIGETNSKYIHHLTQIQSRTEKDLRSQAQFPRLKGKNKPINNMSCMQKRDRDGEGTDLTESMSSITKIRETNQIHTVFWRHWRKRVSEGVDCEVYQSELFCYISQLSWATQLVERRIWVWGVVLMRGYRCWWVTLSRYIGHNCSRELSQQGGPGGGVPG